MNPRATASERQEDASASCGARGGRAKLKAMRVSSASRSFALVLTPLLALWALENWGGERRGATALLLYLPQHPWALWPLAFAVAGAFKRRRSTLAAGVLGLMFWATALLGWRVNLVSRQPGAIRLMSYNIERGLGGHDAIERAIRAQHPDIVCLQESQGVYKTRAFAAGVRLAARFPGWSVAQSGDVMTLSRFPLLSRRDFPLRGTRRVLETTLQTPRGPLRVLNVHVSTSFAGQPYPRPTWKGRIAQLETDIGPSARARLEQIAPLRRAVAASDARVPLIVAGDFNSPPRGWFYRAIAAGLDDAWQRAGRGTGHTFPAAFPLLPIDHALTRGLYLQNAFVPDARASGHRPLVIDFAASP